MQMIPVQSSNIAGVGYDAEAQRLTVAFKSGRRYTYSGVPSDVHEQLMQADSVGQFFHSNIRGQYDTSG